MQQYDDIIKTEIPNEFYSEKTGNRFTNCMFCTKNLLENETLYVIEKAFEKDIYTGQKKLLFEYALCNDCQESISSALSKKSIENISMYFQLYLEIDEEIDNLNDHLQKKLKRCFVSDIHISKLKEYQIIAYFVEDKMLLANISPIMFGEKAILEIQELLSAKTRDYLDGFLDSVLPPEFRETVPDGRYVFL